MIDLLHKFGQWYFSPGFHQPIIILPLFLLSGYFAASIKKGKLAIWIIIGIWLAISISAYYLYKTRG